MGKAKDIRMMTVYGYARLIGFDHRFQAQAPTSSKVSSRRRGGSSRCKLRKGHKWSDGQPFTSEDFRYYFEDVASDPETVGLRSAAGAAVERQAAEV